jgi:hypothetical protein
MLDTYMYIDVHNFKSARHFIHNHGDPILNHHYWKGNLGSNIAKFTFYQLISYMYIAPYIPTHCIRVHLAAAVCVSCQELTSTLREGNYSCQGEEVIFTCTLRGSLGLEWRSPSYIEDGNPLQFSTASVVGRDTTSMINGMITATARLTRNTDDNGMPVLGSTLRITAAEASMVTCSGTSGGTESVEFFISGIHVVLL